jgi:general secretion pathway protein L
VASHVVTLPFTDARRIERVLPGEVEGAIPFDLEDVVWDHAVLSQANGRTEILVGVVKKSALQQALAQLSDAGVDPSVVTFAPLALATPAERGMVARDGLAAGEGGTEAVLDAGPDRANFCMLDGGHPVLARSLSSAGVPAWEAARRDPGALDRLLAPLVRDLKMSLRMRGKAGPVGRLLLAGDLNGLPGSAEKLSGSRSAPSSPAGASTSARASSPSPRTFRRCAATSRDLASRRASCWCWPLVWGSPASLRFPSRSGTTTRRSAPRPARSSARA